MHNRTEHSTSIKCTFTTMDINENHIVSIRIHSLSPKCHSSTPKTYTLDPRDSLARQNLYPLNPKDRQAY